MTLLIRVCFLQPNIMVFKDLPKSFFKMQIKGISCEYESKILRTVQSAVLCCTQRYTYRVLQTIQMKLILVCFWAEPVVLGSPITALKFKYEI